VELRGGQSAYSPDMTTTFTPGYFSRRGLSTESSLVHNATDSMEAGLNLLRSSAVKTVCPIRYIPNLLAFAWTATMSSPSSETSLQPAMLSAGCSPLDSR
jgi:hypothetical protein